MDESNTSLEWKLFVKLKTGITIDTIPNSKNEKDIKEKSEHETKHEDSVKKSIFWKMYLRRKSGLEEMNECVEDLVRECLFWRQQVEGLTYQNYLLELEKRALRDDYEQLLEKTKHDMGIILKLKDSKKKLDHETAEYFKTDKEFTNLQFINTDLRSDKLILETKRNELEELMKKNTVNMSRINKIQTRIQSFIEKEKKRGDRNSQRYKDELVKLIQVQATNDEIFENFKKHLADRELLIADLKSFLDAGLKEYLGLERSESEVKESTNELVENESKPDAMDETAAAENEIRKVKKPVVEDMTPTEQNIFDEWRRNKISSKLVEKENSHLLKQYAHLHKRMKDLNERYMEMADRRNTKEMELQRYLTRASDLNQVVMQKRRKFSIPPRDDRKELKIRIQTQMNEIEALRKLLSLRYFYSNEDNKFHQDFVNDMKMFYTELIQQEKPETIPPVATEEQPNSKSTDSE